MNKFKKNNSRGGGKKFGGFKNKRNDRQMHDAVCANCGDSCKVPFKPSGDKPVYCSNCFEKDNKRSNKPFSFDRYDKKQTSMRGGNKKWDNKPQKPFNDGTAKELEAINKKLDLILKKLK